MTETDSIINDVETPKGETTTSGADNQIQEIQAKITSAFELFDHESNKTVDVREVGTIIRSLGCCPSEAELHDMLTEMEDEEPTGYVKFDNFLPTMTKSLMERRYKGVHEDLLLKAFQVLDVDGKEYLTPEELQKYMNEEGEPFNNEEMDEFLSAAVDSDRGYILYKTFASELVVDET